MPFALTAYEAGQNLGTIVLAVLFVLLLLRAFDVLPRKQPTPRGRLTDLGVAAILGVLLTVAFFNGRADAWEGDEARAMKADFIAACESSVSGVVDCGCVFAEITSATPYDTPEGFARLHDPIWGTNAGGEPPSVPAVYVAAVRRCMGAA